MLGNTLAAPRDAQLLSFLHFKYLISGAVASDDTYFEDDYITPFAVKEDADFVSEMNHLTAPNTIGALSVETLDEDSGDEAKSGQILKSKAEGLEENESSLKTDEKSANSTETNLTEAHSGADAKGSHEVQQSDSEPGEERIVSNADIENEESK